jgi:hypothetical protein
MKDVTVLLLALTRDDLVDLDLTAAVDLFERLLPGDLLLTAGSRRLSCLAPLRSV